MKEEVINKQGKHNSDVLNLKREVSMYKQLLDKQSVNAQIDKRRIMMEELDGDYYADLLEWISDYIFLQRWNDDKLMAMIEEFRAYRQRKYDELVSEREKLRNLDLLWIGRGDGGTDLGLMIQLWFMVQGSMFMLITVNRDSLTVNREP